VSKPLFTTEVYVPKVPVANDVDDAPPPLSYDDYGEPPIVEADSNVFDSEEADLERRIIDAPALARDLEPSRGWTVSDVIPDETLTLLTGPGGEGKSTLALQLGVDMRTDGEWLGIKVKQGPVVYISSEDERRDVRDNLRAILKARGKSLAHCTGLHIISLADRDACLAGAASKTAKLEPTALWKALEGVIERRKPALVIFDALADLYGGDENIRRQVRAFIILLKRLAICLKVAVLLVAHPSLAGINSGSGLSGSTDWHNGPRARLYLAKPKDADGKALDPDLRTLTVMKVQWAQEGTVFRLRRRDGAFVYEGREGGANAPYDKAAALAKAERLFLTLLQTYEDQGRRVSPNSGSNYAPTIFAGDDDAEGVTNKAFARAMSKLLKADRVHIETVGPRSKQREKLTPGPATSKEPAAEDGTK
jgi:RecA-family ATPase